MRQFKYFLFFVVILVFESFFVIPNHYNVPRVKNAGPVLGEDFKRKYQVYIEKNEPELILLGDSTLYENIDQNYLMELIEEKTYKIGNPGSASAVWYLILKNNIIPASHKPKRLYLFFRTSMLTTPEYRTTGVYEKFIAEAGTSDDALLMEYAYLSQMTWLEKWFDQYVPLYAYRAKIQNSIEGIIKYHALQELFSVNKDEIDFALDAVFGETDIMQVKEVVTTAESYPLKDEMLDFDLRLQNSFLPEIIRICQENNIKLTLVYTKTSNIKLSAKTEALLDAYKYKLIQYLDDNDVGFVDYSNDERVLDDFFYDPLHMSAEGRHLFTEIFAQDYIQTIIP